MQSAQNIEITWNLRNVSVWYPHAVLQIFFFASFASLREKQLCVNLKMRHYLNLNVFFYYIVRFFDVNYCQDLDFLAS
jgi:hypothetical protein